MVFVNEIVPNCRCLRKKSEWLLETMQPIIVKLPEFLTPAHPHSGPAVHDWIMHAVRVGTAEIVKAHQRSGHGNW